MVLGLLLKWILRQPWRLVFTSAGQRRHVLFTRWLIRQMDVVIATTEAVAAHREVPSIVIPHGVDTRRFYPAEDRAAAWREAGLPGSFGIGMFGRIRQGKGSDLFIQAMITLLPRYPGATAVIAGLVAPKYRAFAADLQRKVSVAGLADRIIFLGHLPDNKMPGWFRRVSIYVAPMRREEFGLTPLEAMASGTAIVATRTGAAPQLVAHKVTGILVAPGDLESLTSAIESLLADPGKAESMGREGRVKALRDHDIAAEAAAIEAVYESLWNRSVP